MEIKGLVPILYCHDIDASLAFYKDTLRFIEIRRRRGEAGLEWVYLKSDNAFIMLEQCESNQPVALHSIELYFFVDDIQAVFTFIKARGHQIQAPEKTAYGILETLLTDPDGRQVRLGQKLI